MTRMPRITLGLIAGLQWTCAWNPALPSTEMYERHAIMQLLMSTTYELMPLNTYHQLLTGTKLGSPLLSCGMVALLDHQHIILHTARGPGAMFSATARSASCTGFGASKRLLPAHWYFG
jgi:hypothetical protein